MRQPQNRFCACGNKAAKSIIFGFAVVRLKIDDLSTLRQPHAKYIIIIILFFAAELRRKKI